MKHDSIWLSLGFVCNDKPVGQVGALTMAHICLFVDAFVDALFHSVWVHSSRSVVCFVSACLFVSACVC